MANSCALPLSAIDQFQNEVFGSISFFKIIEPGDVGVIQGGEDFSFPLETADTIDIPRKFLGQDLDGNFTLQLQIAGAVHLAHSALAKESRDFMRAKLRADRQSHDFAEDYKTTTVSGRITAIPETRDGTKPPDLLSPEMPVSPHCVFNIRR